jgi:hypothetical protein
VGSNKVLPFLYLSESMTRGRHQARFWAELFAHKTNLITTHRQWPPLPEIAYYGLGLRCFINTYLLSLTLWWCDLYTMMIFTIMWSTNFTSIFKCRFQAIQQEKRYHQAQISQFPVSCYQTYQMGKSQRVEQPKTKEKETDFSCLHCLEGYGLV